MKRCPTCQRTFADETQKFCANDGTPLVADEAPAFDPEATVMSSARPFIEEEPAQPSSDPLPPTQYFTPGSKPAGAQAEQDIHQSYPPPQPSAPGASPSPAWSPTPPQPPQQPQPPLQAYYPQQGTPGGQPPPWQGGQPPPPQQPPWMPQGGQPQAQNWGGYNQPGQYAPYGASPATATAGGSSKVATASLICGIISFIAIAALFIIIGARLRDLRDLIEPLGWLSLGTGLAALICGIVGMIITKTTASRIKSGIGIFLGILPLILFLIGMARRF